MSTGQITTVSFFQFEGGAARWWAFGQMGRAPREIMQLPDVQFGKMLGSGAGQGFSYWPDWSVYALLMVWPDRTSADAFISESPFLQQYTTRAQRAYHLWLQPFKTHGAWEGQQPFQAVRAADPSLPVAILTRATIRARKLLRFWQFVPQASRSIQQVDPPPQFFKGVGEWPLIQQATFSMWNSLDHVKAYAYQQRAHAEVVKRTRKENWYSEELFARFHPIATQGDGSFLHRKT